ncbi:MAG: Asp-tRNA(Asn)/Glu-tRNA(Gln) amidotransferase GatCAB subunit B, partial [Spirochaetia bacterium]|nr:Asp-tRNA(Asn)/Glu-tRNA(Gln) amidotransferase GatCAB subunit B [Spirochaetia bacterium]
IITEEKDPSVIIEENNLQQLDDSGELSSRIDKVLDQSSAAVEQIKSGDMKPIGFLIGQVMKLSGGKADPKKTKDMIMKKIS